MAVNTPPQAYDFAHPGKLSQAEEKRFGYLHADLAGRLQMALAGLVRDYVEITAAEHCEVRWSGLVASLPSPCAVFTFEAPPLKGIGLLRMDPALAFALVDRLFGGKGESKDLGRELTPIEQRVVGRFADTVLAEVESVWKPAFDLRISRIGFASSPDLIETSGIDESVIEVGFKLETGQLSGDFTIVYPLHTFEPAIAALAGKRKAEARQPVAVDPTAMVKTVMLPVTARLTPTMVDIKHLVDLSIGDVLLLDNRVSDDVEVLVGKKPVMKGRPGSRGGRLAVKITGFSEEGGERP